MYVLLLDNNLLRILDDDTEGSGVVTMRVRESSDGVTARGVLL